MDGQGCVEWPANPGPSCHRHHTVWYLGHQSIPYSVPAVTVTAHVACQTSVGVLSIHTPYLHTGRFGPAPSAPLAHHLASLPNAHVAAPTNQPKPKPGGTHRQSAVGIIRRTGKQAMPRERGRARASRGGRERERISHTQALGGRLGNALCPRFFLSVRFGVPCLGCHLISSHLHLTQHPVFHMPSMRCLSLSPCFSVLSSLP
jgi:hypothetical protein